MKTPARTSSSMPRSGIRRIFDLASSIPGAIHLEVGEPNFPTPPHVVEAAARAAREGLTKYTPNAGLPELREALAEKLRARNDIQVEPEQVIVTAGGGEALYSTFLALLDPDDEALIPNPGWPNFAMQVHLVGATPVGYPLDWPGAFLPDPERLEALITPASKVLVLNSPSNPIGAVLDRDRIRDLLSFAAEHDLWVISDECYDAIVFDGEAPSVAPLDPDGRVVSAFSFSKTYAMTGWRIGYLAVPPTLSGLLAKMQEPIISCVNGPTQMAALAALQGPQDVVETMRGAYRERRQEVLAFFEERGVRAFRPQGAFYVWVDVGRSGLSSENFALRLMEERHVAVVPGTTFGTNGEGWVRISLATASDLLMEGVGRLAEALEEVPVGTSRDQ